MSVSFHIQQIGSKLRKHPRYAYMHLMHARMASDPFRHFSSFRFFCNFCQKKVFLSCLSFFSFILYL